MSNKAEQDLAAFYEEFVEGPGINKLIGAQERALLQAAQGGTGARIKYAAEDLAQNHGGPVVAGVLATAALANSGPTMAANAESVGLSGGTAPHAQIAYKTTGRVGRDQIVHLRPGQEIYDIAEGVAEQRGVSTMTEVNVIERASNVRSEAEAERLPVGFPVHISSTNVKGSVTYVVEPQGGNLTFTAKQNGMTLERLLEINPTYRNHPNLVQAGASILVDTLTQTTTTLTPKAHPHHERHISVTPTHTSETPIPAPAPEKPAASVAQPKATVVSPKPHTPIQPHHPVRPAASDVSPKPQAKLIQRTHSKAHSILGPSFGSGLQLDLGQAFSTAGKLSTEDLHRLAQHTLGSVASMEQSIVKGITTPSARKHGSHAALPSTAIEKSSPNAGEKYDIYSNVLTKSGYSAAALQYALSQMEGGSMADLAGDIHDVEQEYGINSLYTAAAGCIESACGTSNFARERNNYFGIQAYTNNPNAASKYGSKRDNVMAFAKLLHDNYLHPHAQYWGGSGSLHSIYKNYSTSHDSEALSISEVMNTLAAHASYFDEIHGSPSVRTAPTAPQQPKHVSHRSATKNHAQRHHSKPSEISSIYKALAHAWNHPLTP